MLSLEIRFSMNGKEVSVDSFVRAIIQELRSSVHEEISRSPSKQENLSRERGRSNTGMFGTTSRHLRERESR
jgi:hypothetical protein